MRPGDYIQTTRKIRTNYRDGHIPIGARGEITQVFKDGWAIIRFYHRFSGYFQLNEKEFSIIVKGVEV